MLRYLCKVHYDKSGGEITKIVVDRRFAKLKKEKCQKANDTINGR